MCSKVKLYKYYWVLLLLCGFSRAGAQGCPPNIGFELATFQNWEVLLGKVDSVNGPLLYPGYDASRHTIYKNTGENNIDPYGNFPINCPNGSGASIKLGNAVGGAQAEGLSYTFTIPSDKKTFSLIYYYAVVMQNPPHGATEQPKFTAKVFNVTTGEYITCSSFEYIAQAGLPGFEASTRDGSVLYKAWTPVTIKLSGYSGNTIRLEFVTNDCTRGGHFGYAYVDVDENCLSPIGGNIVCQYDTALNLTAPYGFQSYRWFTGGSPTVIGTDPSYHQPVIPPDNTEFAVELTPFPNQGCSDTVFTKIHYSTESIVINSPQNIIAGCEDVGIDMTGLITNRGNSLGLLYSFYSDAALTKHVFATEPLRQGGIYYIKGVNEDGCFALKSVTIKINPTPVYTSQYDSKPITRPATLDLTAILSSSGNVITYWKDAGATVPLVNPALIDKDGTYYIKISTAEGCSAITSVTVSFINPPPVIPNAFSPNGDGINDNWVIGNINYYPDLTLNVYSRSGQLVFQSLGGYSKPWDGKQKGADVPFGVYYYVLRLTKSHPPIGGSVTIIR
jgi:gliding motility-associated-like protein